MQYEVTNLSSKLDAFHFDGASIIPRSPVAVSPSILFSGKNKLSAPRKKRGFMEKRGELFKNWKKRYFILEDGILLYKADDREKTPPIKYAKVSSVITWNGRDHGLCIRLDTGRDLYVDAGSDVKREAWCEALESHAKYNKQMQLKKQKAEDRDFASTDSSCSSDDDREEEEYIEAEEQ